MYQTLPTTEFTTFGTRAVDSRTCFDIDEDRRQLLCEVLRKMIGAIDRCTARMDRIFEDMKMPYVLVDESLEMKKPEETDVVKEDQKPELEPMLEEIEEYPNAQNMFPKNESELIQEKKQQILPQGLASYGAAKPTTFQSEEIPTNEQFALSWSTEGLDQSNSGAKFKSYDGDMKGEQLWRQGGFNWVENREVERFRAEEVTAIWMFDPGIKIRKGIVGIRVLAKEDFQISCVNSKMVEEVVSLVDSRVVVEEDFVMEQHLPPNLRNADFIARQFRCNILELAKNDKVYAPDLIGFGWSEKAFIDFDVNTKTGGPDGLIRNEEEYSHGTNIGLKIALEFRKHVTKWSKITYADLYQLAGVVAVEGTRGVLFVAYNSFHLVEMVFRKKLNVQNFHLGGTLRKVLYYNECRIWVFTRSVSESCSLDVCCFDPFSGTLITSFKFEHGKNGKCLELEKVGNANVLFGTSLYAGQAMMWSGKAECTKDYLVVLCLERLQNLGDDSMTLRSSNENSQRVILMDCFWVSQLREIEGMKVIEAYLVVSGGSTIPTNENLKGILKFVGADFVKDRFEFQLFRLLECAFNNDNVDGTGVWIKKFTHQSSQFFELLFPAIQEQLMLGKDPCGNVQVAKIKTEKMFFQLVENVLEVRKQAAAYKGQFKKQTINHLLIEMNGFSGNSFSSMALLFTKDIEVLQVVKTSILFVSASKPIHALAYVVSDLRYAEISMMVVFGGLLVITSCNSTKVELKQEVESFIQRRNKGANHRSDGQRTDSHSCQLRCWQIGYALVSMISRGIMLGTDHPVMLRMLDIPPVTDGDKMELVDATFPSLKGVVSTIDTVETCTSVNIAVMIYGFLQKEGMEWKDVMSKNVSFYKFSTSALEKHATAGCKVLVVANPANTTRAATTLMIFFPKASYI